MSLSYDENMIVVAFKLTHAVAVLKTVDGSMIKSFYPGLPYDIPLNGIVIDKNLNIILMHSSICIHIVESVSPS